MTPQEGLQDLEFTGRYGFGDIGPFRNISTAVSYHVFHPERSGPRFGQEVDFDITAAFGDFSLAFTFAHYDADTFASDTERVFLSLTKRF